MRRRLGGAQPARGAADEHADPFFRLPSQVSGRLPDAGPKSKGFEHRSNRRDWRPADCCDQMRLLGLWQPQRGVSEGSGGHRRDHASGGGGLGRRLAFVQARLDLRGTALHLELEGPPITIAYPLLHLRRAGAGLVRTVGARETVRRAATSRAPTLWCARHFGWRWGRVVLAGIGSPHGTDHVDGDGGLGPASCACRKRGSIGPQASQPTRCPGGRSSVNESTSQKIACRARRRRN